MLHRTRHLFIRQQTAVINAIRAHLAKFGIVAPVGRNGVEQLLGVVADAKDKRLPEVAHAAVPIQGELRRLDCRNDLHCGNHRGDAGDARSSAVLAIGGLTYPLYLLHQNIGYLVFKHIEHLARPSILVLAIATAMIAASWAVWRYVDRPAQQLLKRALTKAAARLGWAAEPRPISSPIVSTTSR
jgi:hypothetical protein